MCVLLLFALLVHIYTLCMYTLVCVCVNVCGFSVCIAYVCLYVCFHTCMCMCDFYPFEMNDEYIYIYVVCR